MELINNIKDYSFLCHITIFLLLQFILFTNYNKKILIKYILLLILLFYNYVFFIQEKDENIINPEIYKEMHLENHKLIIKNSFINFYIDKQEEKDKICEFKETKEEQDKCLKNKIFIIQKEEFELNFNKTDNSKEIKEINNCIFENNCSKETIEKYNLNEYKHELINSIIEKQLKIKSIQENNIFLSNIFSLNIVFLFLNSFLILLILFNIKENIFFNRCNVLNLYILTNIIYISIFLFYNKNLLFFSTKNLIEIVTIFPVLFLLFKINYNNLIFILKQITYDIYIGREYKFKNTRYKIIKINKNTIEIQNLKTEKITTLNKSVLINKFKLEE